MILNAFHLLLTDISNITSQLLITNYQSLIKFGVFVKIRINNIIFGAFILNLSIA